MTASAFKLKHLNNDIEIVTPSTGMVEKIAMEYAACWYEAARSSGLKPDKYKTARSFARAKFDGFIPEVVKNLITMLGNPKLPPDQKMMIYDELMKRANDPEARKIFPSKTEADKDLNFDLPDNFFENTFPDLAEQISKKIRMN